MCRLFRDGPQASKNARFHRNAGRSAVFPHSSLFREDEHPLLLHRERTTNRLLNTGVPLDQGQAKIAAWDRGAEEAVEATIVPPTEAEKGAEDAVVEADGDGDAPDRD